MTHVQIHDEVRAALGDGRPVVALESAVITHGLPRPDNLDTARRMAQAVRSGGATGGTTVSATLVACGRAEPAAIRVLATGGIGGVHPAWSRQLDVSADLGQLRRSPVCVVCAGAKSILDLPATLEALESLGVPVVGYGTDHFPRFHLAGAPALPVPMRVDDARAAADLCVAQWWGLKQESAVVLAVPVPAEAALTEAELDAALAGAEAAARAQGVAGAARTPFVLDELARRTAGRTIVANVALLLHNAAVAADVAAALAGRGPERPSG